MQTFKTNDDSVDLYEDRDPRSQVVTRAPKGSDIQLGDLQVVNGREWMEAALEDGSTGYVLGPTARGHTTLGSPPAPAMATATGLSGSEQLAPGDGNASTVKRTGNNRIEKTWICPKCNVAVDSPKISENKKRTCDLGHKLEQPMGFLGGLIAPASLWVMGAAASHIVGGIWSTPGRWIIAFTLFGVGVAPWIGLIRGVVNTVRGGIARRLASGYLGMMLGSLIIIFIIALAEGVALQSGATRCTNPDQPYLTDSMAERIYRFFLPYGLDVAEQHCANK